MPQNYSETDLVRLRKKRDAAIGWTELREVNLGAVIDGARYIGAGGTKVWVTEQGRSSYTVERGDANVPDQFGKLVIVGIAPGQNYIQLFTGAGSSNGNPTSPSPGGTIAHASQHLLTFRWREDARSGDGVDPAFIGLHQIKDLLVEPESGFTCRVGAGWATVNGTDVYIPSGSFFVVDDSQIPAGAGDALIVRVELDDAEQFQLSYGSDFAEPVTPEAALGNAPAATPGRNTLAYLWLPNGATSILRNYILPTPPHLRAGGDAAAGLVVDDETTTVDPVLQITLDGNFFDVSDLGGGQAFVTIIAGSAGVDTATGALASIPGSPTTGDLYLPNDVPYLMRYNGSSWDSFWNGIPVTQPPSSGWSWDNQDSATIDSLFYLEKPADSANEVTLRYRTAPTPPYVITALFRINIVGAANARFGMAFRQSSDGKLADFGIQFDATRAIFSQKWTSSTSFSTSYTTAQAIDQTYYWLRIADNNTNRICSIFDGHHAIAFHTIGRTDFLTADQVGFYIAPRNATYAAGVQLLSWAVT